MAIGGFAIAAFAAGLAGCVPPVDVPLGDPQAPVSFSGQVQPLLAARCGDYHTAGGVATFFGYPLRLDPELAYESLLTTSALRDENLRYVVPGDPDGSYLIEKISSNQPRFGNRMPLGSVPLTEAQIGVIRRWIAEGALDN
jgi:hypothetical protein